MVLQMITPLDIQIKIFKKGLRGYNMVEVDEFLNTVIDGYEQLYRQNIESRDKISSMQDTINHYKALEETLKSTLVTAQQTGESIKQVANEKAQSITDEAVITAKRLISDANEEVRKISQRYEDLKRNIDVYKARMTSLLNSQLNLLNNVVSDKTLTELVGVNEALQELEEKADISSDTEQSDNNNDEMQASELQNDLAAEEIE